MVYPTTGAGQEGGRFGMDRRAEIWTNNNTGRGMDKAGAGRGAEIRESDTLEGTERTHSVDGGQI